MTSTMISAPQGKPKRHRSRVLISVSVAAVVGIAAAVALGAAPAQAASIFTVNWTGIGIYPRSGPSMGSNRVGPALSDGTSIGVQCEQDGDTVVSDAGTSAIWERLDDGSWLPNAFVDTGADGFSPGVPRCDQPAASPSAVAETPYPIDADIYVPNEDVYTALLDHYFDATGETVQVDFSFYASDARLMNWARTLPADSMGRQYKSTANDGDVYWASGAFSVARTSEHCWSIRDHYDFAPDKPTNWIFIGNWGSQFFGNAKEFTVRSSGCQF